MGRHKLTELIWGMHLKCQHFCSPPSPRSAQKTEYEFKEFMNKIPPRAKKEMARRGKVMITYQALPEKHISNCFRMVITALPRATEDSIDNVIHELWDIIKDYRMEDFRE